jgi:hypothetical protein
LVRRAALYLDPGLSLRAASLSPAGEPTQELPRGISLSPRAADSRQAITNHAAVLSRTLNRLEKSALKSHIKVLDPNWCELVKLADQRPCASTSR